MTGESDDPDGKAPVAIFVLDRLNCAIDDFERGRQNLISYLKTLPGTLESPAEIMLLNNNSMEMVQGYTRKTPDLISAVQNISPGIPYKFQRPDYDAERTQDSLYGLIHIAIQNTGIGGRKNIFWIGPGGPSLTRAAYGTKLDRWQLFMHGTIDLLVDSRISLFMIYPALKVAHSSLTLNNFDADDRESNIGNNRIETGDVNFPLVAQQTGGALFYNRNDIAAEIGESRNLGANYFTLTYQSSDHSLDGKYRNIRIGLRNPELGAVTKRGYWALALNQQEDPRRKTIVNITHAASASVPFHALDLRITDVVRIPDTHSAQFTVHIKPRNLGWLPTEDGKKTANLVIAATSLSDSKKILAWKFEKLNLNSAAPDPNQVTDELRVRLTATIPSKAEFVRVVLETADAGRIGTADIDRATLQNAPLAPPTASPNAAGGQHTPGN